MLLAQSIDGNIDQNVRSEEGIIGVPAGGNCMLDGVVYDV